MATTQDYALYVCDRIAGVGQVRYRKMFGEYMVYVKMLDCVKGELETAELGVPYSGVKPHYIFDINDSALAKRVAALLAENVPFPTPRKRKQKTGGNPT